MTPKTPIEAAADDIRQKVKELNQAVHEATKTHGLRTEFDTMLEHHFMGQPKVPLLIVTVSKEL